MALIPILITFILFIVIYKNINNIDKLYVSLLAYACIIDIAFDRAAFVISGMEINCGLIIRIILLAVCIFYLKDKNVFICNKMQFWALLLLISLAVGMLYAMLVPYDVYVVENWDDYIVGKEYAHKKIYIFKDGVKNYLAIVIYLINAYAIKLLFRKKEFVLLLKKVFYGCQIMTIYGCVELILKKILVYPQPILSFVEISFGVTSTNYNSAGVVKNGVYLLQGFQAEPSQFVLHLFTVFLFGLMIDKIHYVEYRKHNANVVFCLFLCFCLILLSGGFSALFCCILMLMIATSIYNNWYRLSAKKVMRAIAVMVFIMLVGWIYLYYLINDYDSYWGERMRATLLVLDYLFTPNGLAILNYADSSLARFISIVYVFDYFLERPLFGLGVGYAFAHDSVVSFLSDFGLIGAFLWFKFITCKDQYKHSYDMTFFVLYFLIAGFPEGDARSYAGRIYVFLLFESTKWYSLKNNRVDL